MPQSCFIIQPFDDGKYDKLFEDVFDPAVKSAGLEPYRVDLDPSTTIPIVDIERGIKDSAICFAEISTDNPNVWFELGYAISKGKSIIMVCAEGRTKYPFDIQHRAIISYVTESPRDFQKLKQQITEKIKSTIKKEVQHQSMVMPDMTKPKSGLKSHEIACLVTIAIESEGLSGSVSGFQVQSKMASAGYNTMATKLALRKLITQNFLGTSEERDYDNSPYEAYSMLEPGWDWVEQNEKDLNLKISSTPVPKFDTNTDDDIPF